MTARHLSRALLLLALAPFLSPAQAQKPMHPSQVPYLLQLRAAWGNFTDLSTWNASNPCNHWRLITCWPNGTVRTMDVSRQSLYTTLPAAIGGLQTMEKFYATTNWLYGTLPSSLGNLTSLLVLQLFGNYFTGSIPQSLGNLGRIGSLSLNINYLNGSIPPTFVNLRKTLKYLNVGSNWLEGTIPTTVCALTGLTELRLQSNHFNGTIPTCLVNLQQLKLMYLDTNRLTGPIPPELGYMPRLNNMFLNQNNIQGPIPTTFSGLWSLSILFLSSNPYITGPLPDTLGQLPNLRALVMEFCAVNGTIPASLGQITTLERLLLDNNKLDGTLPSSLGNLNKLTLLYLESNKLYGSIPYSISKLKSLVLLQLNNNMFSGSPPTGFPLILNQYNIHHNFFNGMASFYTQTATGNSTFCPGTSTTPGYYSSIQANCLQFASDYPCKRESQTYSWVCRNFCGADSPPGPCGGHGFCRMGPEAPHCLCFAGYVPSPDGLNCVAVNSTTKTAVSPRTTIGLANRAADAAATSAVSRTAVLEPTESAHTEQSGLPSGHMAGQLLRSWRLFHTSPRLGSLYQQRRWRATQRHHAHFL